MELSLKCIRFSDITTFVKRYCLWFGKLELILQGGPKKTSKIENNLVQKVFKILQQTFQRLLWVTTAFFNRKMKVKRWSSLVLRQFLWCMVKKWVNSYLFLIISLCVQLRSFKASFIAIYPVLIVSLHQMTFVVAIIPCSLINAEVWTRTLGVEWS